MSVNASALEEFRQQWQDEVEARKRQEGKKSTGSTRRPSEGKLEQAINHPPARHPMADLKDDSDHELVEGSSVGRHSAQLVEKLDKLEHFERGVEKERSGNLGDSLAHYRKAYRLDDTVDQQYRKKHFPAKPRPPNINPSNAPVTVPNPAHHSSEAASEPLTISQLIESFAGCQIEGAPPIIAGDVAPPCTISKLPQEVLVELLCHIGRHDPAVLARLALVCKRLAYQIYADNSIWKLIALGPEFGLASQQYNFERDLQGREIGFESLDEEPLLRIPPPRFTASALYRDIFHSFPRVRFTGVYISTVNYTRPGGPSATQLTLSNPIHIVTYYRYLRFFRDGTCISLLTTSEPIDVVHHLTAENLNLVRSKGPHHPLNSISSAPTPLPATGSSKENHVFDAGDLHIETEGASSKYRYTIHLALKHASRSRTTTKNNKL
ncbi:hypothetical protein DV736_g3269, partial [Chaetothyriales sp. CBS 134916]